MSSGNLNSGNITGAIANASIDEIYQNVLGRAPDEAGKAYWLGEIANGNIKPADIDEAIKNAAKLNGFANGGYTGNYGINEIAGVVHGQEYVVDAPTTHALGLNGTGGLFEKMLNIIEQQNSKIQNLENIMSKVASDTNRNTTLLDRITPDGDAMQVRITA